MTQINFGILIPTYNRDHKIVKRAIISAMNQVEFLPKDLDFELTIFICSDTEKSEAAIEKLVHDLTSGSYSHDLETNEITLYTETGIVIVYRALGHHSNDYANTPRNKLIEMSEDMDYLLFLDDDNIIFPEYLATAYQCLLDHGTDVAISKIYHNGPLVQEYTPPIILDGTRHEVGHLDTLQFFMKAKVMQEHGWNTEAGYVADGYTFKSILQKYTYSYTNELLGVHI